jgi:hypothetical protein
LVAGGGQQRQGQAGGQGQVELGGAGPPAQVAAFALLAGAGLVDHAGQQGAGQGQVGAQGQAAGQADGGEEGAVARAQGRGAGKAATLAAMPARQVGDRPQRRTARTHSGRPSAAAPK